jgi:hypothetical protein
MQGMRYADARLRIRRRNNLGEVATRNTPIERP